MMFGTSNTRPSFICKIGGTHRSSGMAVTNISIPLKPIERSVALFSWTLSGSLMSASIIAATVAIASSESNSSSVLMFRRRQAHMNLQWLLLLSGIARPESLRRSPHLSIRRKMSCFRPNAEANFSSWRVKNDLLHPNLTKLRILEVMKSGISSMFLVVPDHLIRELVLLRLSMENVSTYIKMSD